MAGTEDRETRVLGGASLGAADGVLLLRVLSGELKGSESVLADDAPFTIGAGMDTTLRLPDPSVSRRHLELVNHGGYVTARDLGSTNGSFYEGSRFERLDLGPGAVFRLGETELQLVAPERADPIPPSERHAFGRVLGRSRRMREIFALLERASRTDATVLITGETGTGKEVVAEAIHHASPRKNGPFVVVDCASIPSNLIESELFGHVKGAYTNALTDRTGAFESANGGTIFLDELGELPPGLQPRLLRVLESRQIKRVGSNRFSTIDVRVVAATNRNLEEEVQARRFRSDLYYRLAVVKVALPSLRERREDVPMLAESFLSRHTGESRQLELTPEVVAALTSYDWPGNVRELRNVIDQAASLTSEGLNLALRLRGQASHPQPGGEDASPDIMDLPYKEARRLALERFEETYAEHVVARAGGNITKAAELAQVHRNVLHRILARTRDSTPPEASEEAVDHEPDTAV